MGFKATLDTLKLSSREAIVNGEKKSLNALKKYLHIERNVERDLSELIKVAYHSDKPQLILIIGNVGDGKSHLLAKMWEKHPLEMQSFQVHNDATESKSINESYLDSLAEVLKPFSDTKIQVPGNQTKIVIAINLGTLTNFLDEKGNGFLYLKEFILNNQILLDDAQIKKGDDDYIRYINLADYHIYCLSKDGPTSNILEDIISKITTKDDKNLFYKAYQQFYDSHPTPEYCPIKYNFDLLGQEEVKLRVIQVLIEAIVKFKLIVSVRLIMNFIYDLIVPPGFSSLSEKEIIKIAGKSNVQGKFYQWTLPWLLFESHNTSVILRHINKLDPVGSTNENLDHLIIKIGTSVSPSTYFVEYGMLDREDTIFQELGSIPTLDRIKLFVRLNFLKNLVNEFIESDTVYTEFMKNLYFYQAYHRSKLLDFYRKGQKAIFLWNGIVKSDEGYLNINIGRSQNRYKVSQKIQMVPAPKNTPPPINGFIDRFSTTLALRFKVNGSEEALEVKVDYALYRLLMSINQGYRANFNDKNNHVDFKQFINRLSNLNSQGRDVFIQEVQGKQSKKFKLSFTEGFDIFQFEEIK